MSRVDHMRLKYKIQYWFTCDIRCKLPKSTWLRHPIGILIDDNVEIGENVEIFHHVTIGRRYKNISSKIIIGNNVRICAGAVIVGNVKIGDGALIGANAVVLHDVPAGKTCIGIPGKIIRKGKLSNIELVEAVMPDDLAMGIP